MDLPLKRRAFGPVAALLLATFVSGCANVGPARDPADSPVLPGEVPAVVSLTLNTGHVPEATTMSVRRLEANGSTAQVLVLRRVLPELSRDTALFVGALPTGRYRLDDVKFGDKLSVWLGEKKVGALWEFEVDGKQPVDLGRLVLTPTLGAGILVGRSRMVASNQDLLQQFAPKYSSLFQASVPARGWTGEPPLLDLTEGLARQRPEGLSELRRTADGRVLTGTRLGHVFELDREGRWHAVRAASLNAVLAVLPVGQEGVDYYAAGEFASLWRVRTGSRQLERVATGTLPAGNVVFLAGNAGAGWYAAVQAGDKLKIARTDRFDSGQWQIVRELALPNSFWSGQSAPMFWSTPGGFGMAMSLDSRLSSYDFASAAWTESAAPGGGVFMAVRAEADGSLLALVGGGTGLASVFTSAWQTERAGKPWREIKPPYTINPAPPVALPGGVYLMVSGPAGDGFVKSSRDSGATWQVHAPHRKGWIVQLMGPDLLVRYPNPATARVASALEPSVRQFEISRDQGLTWQSTRVAAD